MTDPADTQAARQQRRDDAGRGIDRAMAARVLDRLDLGKQPIPGEAVVLRAVLTAEQAENDQAHADLATERALHEEHRLAIARALGKRGGPGTVPQTWALLTEHTAETYQWAMDGALGRTPAALRAKKRAEAAEGSARRYRTAWHKARERARVRTEARDAYRARADRAEKRAEIAERDTKIYRDRLDRLSEGYAEHRRRAEQAETGRVAADNMLRAVCDVFGGQHVDPVIAARETLARAEKAERAADLLADAERNRQDAEDAIARVRARIADDFRHDHRALIEAALDGTTPPMLGDRLTAEQHAAVTDAGLPPGTVITASAVSAALDGEQPATKPAPARTNARPRCTCAGVGFGTGDCAAHYPPEPEHTHLTEPQPILIRMDLVNADKALRDAVRRAFGGETP